MLQPEEEVESPVCQCDLIRVRWCDMCTQSVTAFTSARQVSEDGGVGEETEICNHF